MAIKIMTVEDVLRRLQTLKKEIEYLTGLEEKWREQKDRFPLIYEGIRKQIEALKERKGQLKTLKVETALDLPESEEPRKQEVQNLQEESRLAPESVSH
jgi:hypothetical protein